MEGRDKKQHREIGHINWTVSKNRNGEDLSKE
jgi:hypothetical protein